METYSTITKIRSDADKMENERRIIEEQSRKEWFDDIQNEVHTSYKKNIGIELKWQELDDRDDCEELAKEIEQ